MREMPYYHSFFGRAPEPIVRLAHKLAEVTPEGINKFFFACSGSEVVDTAIKMIWCYNNATGRHEKKNHFASEFRSWGDCRRGVDDPYSHQSGWI